MPGLLSARCESKDLPASDYTRWRWNTMWSECAICRAQLPRDARPILLVNGHYLELHLREKHEGQTMHTYWREHVKIRKRAV
jgi:hypothetical protein